MKKELRPHPICRCLPAPSFREACDLHEKLLPIILGLSVHVARESEKLDGKSGRS